MNKNSSFIIGRVAAIFAAVMTIIFAISLIWEVIDLSVFTMTLGYVACIFIAISVVIMMACLYDIIREQSKIAGLLALVASIIYAPFCITSYYIQLTNVLQNPLGLSSEILDAIAFKPGSPIFAIDMLGYGFLCLSTLAAGFALKGAKTKVKQVKALQILCFIHGGLAVFTFASPLLSGLFVTAGETDFTGHYVLLFWSAIFVPIAILFMQYFKEGQKQMLATLES